MRRNAIFSVNVKSVDNFKKVIKKCWVIDEIFLGNAKSDLGKCLKKVFKKCCRKFPSSVCEVLDPLVTSGS